MMQYLKIMPDTTGKELYAEYQKYSAKAQKDTAKGYAEWYKRHPTDDLYHIRIR